MALPLSLLAVLGGAPDIELLLRNGQSIPATLVPVPSPTPAPGVANIAALEAIVTTGLPNGSQVTVATVLQPYTLDVGSTATADGITVVTPTTGPGRWIRSPVIVGEWALQTTWFVDTAAGNDENDGSSSATPGAPGVGALKTIAEVCRRCVGVYMPPALAVAPNTVPGIVVNVNGAVAATDTLDWNPHILDQSGAAIATPIPNNTFVTWKGTLPAPTVMGVAGGTTAGTTPATNTQAILGGAIAAGATVGQIVQMTSGLFSGYQARILKDLGGGDARVGNWFLPGTAPYSGNGTYAAVGAGPAPGDSYEVLPLVPFAGAMRTIGNPSRWVQVPQNLLFTAAAVLVDEDASVRMLTCSVQCPLSAQTAVGPGFGADLRFFGCAVMPPDHAIVMFDRRIRFVGSELINATLVGQNTGRVEIFNAVIQGGANGGGIHAGRGYVGFGGDTSQNGGQVAIFASTYGLGVFDTPAPGAGITSDGNALGSFRNGTVSVDAPLYGSGNNVGTNCDEGGTIVIRSTVTPTLTGTTELEQAGDGGTSIPALTAGAAVPAASALATWANWAAAPFSRNVLSYKNGSKIISAANPD